MIDRSIPYISVMMVKRDARVFPVYALPEGYSFDFFRPETGRADWKRVQFNSKQIEDAEQIDAKFESEFMDRRDWLPERMLFVRDSNGDAVASAALWYGAPFGYEMERVHWVATDERHQGRGLCKVLLSRLMQRYIELGAKGDIYLSSQTYSYPAIAIYQKFGFARHMGPAPLGWQGGAFEETARRAWELIDSKLNARA